MSWNSHHSRSEKLAADAEVALRSGDLIRARQLYVQAAAEEINALAEVHRSKQRTLGITP